MSAQRDLPAGRDLHSPALLRIFAPAPSAEVMLEDPAEIKTRCRYWQRRILLSTIIGYAMFYFVRKNLSLAMPGMGKELGISKVDLGLFLTLHGLLYGISKFANGFLGDRSNARTFMAAGLILSAIINVFFGFSLKQVFINKHIWLVGLASFFIYTIRYAVLDWGPTLLIELKHVELTHSGWMVAGFEVSGVAGMVISG